MLWERERTDGEILGVGVSLCSPTGRILGICIRGLRQNGGRSDTHCLYFPSSNVLLCGYVSHVTHGQKRGRVLKNQWFLWKGFYGDILPQVCDGKKQLEEVLLQKRIGESTKPGNVCSLIASKVCSYQQPRFAQVCNFFLLVASASGDNPPRFHSRMPLVLEGSPCLRMVIHCRWEFRDFALRAG